MSQNLIKFKAKKSLGQNFLIDKNIIKKIVNYSKITTSDTILEVGPGTGSLTDEIIKQNPKKIIFSFTRTIITRTQLILTILIGIQMSQHFLSFDKTLVIRIHLGLQRLTLRTSTRYFCMIPQINHYLATVKDSLVPVA